jgi:MFS family permease
MNKSKTSPGVDRFTAASLGAIVACTIGNVLSSAPIVNATFGTFLIPITHEFGWSRTQFTAVLTLLSLLGLAAYPLAGKAADRFGARRVLLIGQVMFALSMASLYFCNSQPVVLYGLYLFVGVAAALPSTVVLSKLIGGWFVKQRGMVLGITAGCGINIGYAVLPKVSETMIEHLGWRWAYVGLAGLILAGIPVMFFLKEKPVDATQDAAQDETGMTGAEIRRTPQFWLLLLAVALGTGAFAALITHRFAYAHDRGLSPDIAIYSIMAGSTVTGLWQVVLGRMLDKSKTPRLAAPMVLVALVGLALMMFTSSTPLWILGGLLSGISSGSEYGLIPYAVQRYFGRRAFGETYGLIFGATMLSMGFFPLLAAMGYDAFGSYNVSFFVAAAMIAASGALMAILPPYVAVQRDMAGPRPRSKEAIAAPGPATLARREA